MYEYTQCVFGLRAYADANAPHPNYMDHCYALAAGAPLSGVLAAAPTASSTPVPIGSTATVGWPSRQRARCELPIEVSASGESAIPFACAGLPSGGRAQASLRAQTVGSAQWTLQAGSRTFPLRGAGNMVEVAAVVIDVPPSGNVLMTLGHEPCERGPCALTAGTLLIEELDPLEPVTPRPNDGQPRPLGDEL